MANKIAEFEASFKIRNNARIQVATKTEGGQERNQNTKPTGGRDNSMTVTLLAGKKKSFVHSVRRTTHTKNVMALRIQKQVKYGRCF